MPPENDTVTGSPFRFFSARNVLISFTARLCMRFRWSRLQEVNTDRSASLTSCAGAGWSMSRILMARSAPFSAELSSSAMPTPILWPFLRMTESPLEKSPMTSLRFSPGIVFPLRCPDSPQNHAMFFVATGLNMSAPGCLTSRTILSRRMSNLTMPRTAPSAMTSSVRSSPGTLFSHIDFPLRGESVPNMSRNRCRTSSTLSPMHGLMSPGLLTLNSLPAEPHTEQDSPSRSVPQLSHHLQTSLPWAMF